MQIFSRFFIMIMLTGMLLPVVGQPKKAILEKSDREMSKRFDEMLSASFSKDGPGCAAIVARKGEVVYRNAFGKADLEMGVDMTPEMIFRIGSITKQFTAVAILQLEEAGKLSVKDPITRFIPDYPTHGYTITIEHLLTHTSGIKSYTNMTEWTAEVRRKDMPLDTLIAFFKDQPMEFEPGTKWNYCNSGYILLGKIIEVASGMPYAQYLQEKMFTPLGLNHTSYDTTGLVIRNRARGYGKGNSGWENAEYLSMTQPHAAGSLISTVDDLYQWNLGIRSGKIIHRENLEKAFIPFKTTDGNPTGYGYGWAVGEIDGIQIIEHGGGINGFLTMGIWIPSEEAFVAVFSNCEAISPDNAAFKMAAILLDKLPAYKSVALDSAALSKFTGIYENGSEVERTITLKEGKLWSQRTGGGLFELTPYGPNLFHFSDGMATYEFHTGDDGSVTGVTFRRLGSEVSEWKKSDRKVEAKKEVTVDAAILQQYVGEYELAPGFTLTMTLENGKLMTRATGQPQFELFAESENIFFLKVVDAKVEFLRDPDGKVSKLILRQNGEHEAKRVR